MARPLTRSKRTMRRLGPLTREIQAVQNDLVKLARRLDRLQTKIQDAETAWQIQQREAERLAAAGLTKFEPENWESSGIVVEKGGKVRNRTKHD